MEAINRPWHFTASGRLVTAVGKRVKDEKLVHVERTFDGFRLRSFTSGMFPYHATGFEGYTYGLTEQYMDYAEASAADAWEMIQGTRQRRD